MKYRVRLSAQERASLKAKIRSGASPAREILHAQVLLRVDATPGVGAALTDAQAARETGLSARTVQRIRQRCAQGGAQAALARKPQPARPEKRRLDDAAEARLVALACSESPEGYARWSVRLLADRVVELGVSEAPVGRETVRRALKKTSSSPGEPSAG
jgi:hypothetical protein